MPTTRRRRGRGRLEEIEDSPVEFLVTGSWRGEEDHWLDQFTVTEAEIAAAWRELGADLTAAWVRDHPGSRPAGWWMFNAPEPRRRLGGTGEPFEDAFERGLPEFWLTVDANDPPTFEAEPTYLARLGLLSASERRRLKAEAFEPEVIAVEPEDDDAAEDDQQTLQAPVSGPTDGADDAEAIPASDGAQTATGAVDGGRQAAGDPARAEGVAGEKQ